MWQTVKWNQRSPNWKKLTATYSISNSVIYRQLNCSTAKFLWAFLDPVSWEWAKWKGKTFPPTTGWLRSELDSKYIEPTSYHYSLGSKLNFQLRPKVVVDVGTGTESIAILVGAFNGVGENISSGQNFAPSHLRQLPAEIERNVRPLEPWRASGKL